MTSSSTTDASYNRCLVIGGNGLVGRHLVEDLIGKGKQVAVFDIAKAPAYDEDPLLRNNVGKFYKGDITNKQVC
jgi:nucleoside-diphosphate-sugar epimerase